MSNKSTSNIAHQSQDKKRQTSKPGNNNSYKNKSSQPVVTSPYHIIPIFIILCILPLIVRLKVYNPNMAQFRWFTDTDSYGDFFLYYKQWTLVLIAGIMALSVGCKAYFNRKAIRFSPIFIPLAVYALLALVSAIFSDYASFSFLGSFEQFESVFALLGYCMIAYYAFLFINSEQDLRLIVIYLIAVAILMSILGVFQYMGHDFFGSKIGYNLIIPERYRSASEIGFKFEENRVYLTLYNPNYVGVYAALVAPIIMVMLFFQKNIKLLILSVIALIGLVICIIGAQSLAGIMGIGVTALFIVLFMWRYLAKRYYITIPTILLIIISLFVLNYQTDKLLVNKLTNMFKTAKTDFALTEMNTKDDSVELLYNGNTMYVQYIDNENQTVSFLFLDENNQKISATYEEDSSSFVITDERFLGISVGIDDSIEGSFYIHADNQKWLFTNQYEDGTYYHINRMGKLDKMVTAPSAVFSEYEGFATNRGYIWSRTIPLLKDYVFLGSGPDTFAMVYPQQDYINFERYGYGNGIITKPHNLYLQIATQTGILSLIAFLVFYGMYFVASLRLYIKGRFSTYYAQVGLAIFIGTIAYMVTGLTNDSSITTAPIFWVLIGTGIAVNYKVKPMILEEVTELKKKKAEAVNIATQSKE